jgi:hypothetical protein
VRTSREKRESIVLKHVAAENRHDVDASIATFHNTPYYEVQPMGIVHDDKKGWVNYTGIFKGFPDFTVEILKTHHSDDAVILEVRMKVTHQGEWAGLKLMGKTMNVPVACILISIKTD